MFIPTSTFIDFATFVPPPCLFQPPRLFREMRVCHSANSRFKSEVTLTTVQPQVTTVKLPQVEQLLYTGVKPKFEGEIMLGLS